MKFLPYWLVAIVAILLDQITKWAILAKFEYMERMNIIPNLFDLTLVYNPGAAFSFLANHSGWQKYFFIVLAFVISAWLARAIVKGEFGRWGNWAAACIIGGALGNVIDRFVHGKVVDFLLVYYENWYYPAFNVADSFICVGAALLVIDGIKQAKKAKQAG
ncbi:signal peptidase II [Wielerella bovis]|uniref:signal peptidase II n=1 Tax=Wielerella bovis TaxID=2917790 RepID=UPI002018E6F4|nr:signal peptidase II [Wielerella bovis]ULJ69314.1 signal peptidase II [Wielerella bovis]